MRAPKKIKHKKSYDGKRADNLLNTVNLAKDVGNIMAILKSWLTTKISPHTKEKEKLVNFV